MGLKGITLRGLEVFEAIAEHGSVAGAAQATGLSQPAVSQQLRNLETALGVPLVDHARRPMQLTGAGRSFLGRTQTVLSQLRLGRTEVSVMDLSHLQALSLGVIDDFDNDLTPRLVTLLADSLTQCQFKLTTAPSHEISHAMQAGQLDMAIAASSGVAHSKVAEIPLVRDPFIFIAPRSAFEDGRLPSDIMQDLPFLRYDRDQLIGRTIEQHLRASGHSFDTRFEIGAHLSLMTLVARGAGWAITTPLGYMRAARVHDQIKAAPVPLPDFHRTISLFFGTDWTGRVPLDVASTVQTLVQDMVITPAIQALPWLDRELTLLELPEG